MRERILITGPGGRVGPRILPLLRPRFALRLLDAKPLPTEGDDEAVVGDIRDLSAIRDACQGVKAMIHLAAISDEADFVSRLLPMNLLGVYNAFEAARQAGVRKVIFTSTGQTILNYGRDAAVTTDMPVRPSTVYGCTKVFGEALARHYADKYGMSMICIRLCWFQPPDREILRSQPELQTHWCSPRDLTQLLELAIATPLAFGIYFGLSNNTGCRFDLGNARRELGYAPQDNALEFLAGTEGLKPS